MQRVLVFLVMSFVLVGLVGFFEYKQAKEKSDLILTIKNCSVYNIGFSDAINRKTPLIGLFMKPENQALLESHLSGQEIDQESVLLFGFYIKAYRSGYNDGSKGKENEAAKRLMNLKSRLPEKAQEIEALYNEYYRSDQKKAEMLRKEKSV